MLYDGEDNSKLQTDVFQLLISQLNHSQAVFEKVFHYTTGYLQKSV